MNNVTRSCFILCFAQSCVEQEIIWPFILLIYLRFAFSCESYSSEGSEHSFEHVTSSNKSKANRLWQITKRYEITLKALWRHPVPTYLTELSPVQNVAHTKFRFYKLGVIILSASPLNFASFNESSWALKWNFVAEFRRADRTKFSELRSYYFCMYGTLQSLSLSNQVFANRLGFVYVVFVNSPYKWWLFCTRNDDAVSESLDDVGSVDGDSVTSESSSESSKSPDEAEKLSSGVPSAIDLSKPWVDISLLECEGPGLFMVRKRWRT